MIKRPNPRALDIEIAPHRGFIRVHQRNKGKGASIWVHPSYKLDKEPVREDDVDARYQPWLPKWSSEAEDALNLLHEVMAEAEMFGMWKDRGKYYCLLSLNLEHYRGESTSMEEAMAMACLAFFLSKEKSE